MATSARFGEVNLYCTWAPAAVANQGTILGGTLIDPVVTPPAYGTDAIVMADVGPGNGDAGTSGGDVTPSGRPYEVYAYPLPLALRDAIWIAVKPTDNAGAFAVGDIPALMQRLLEGAGRAIPAGARAYFVLHLGKYEPATGSPRRGNGGLVGPPAIDNQAYRGLVAALDGVIPSLQASTGPSDVDEGAGAGAPGGETESEPRDRLYFDHYSPSEERRGYVVLDPRLSLVVDGGQEDAHVLLGLAQQATLTADGLAAASYSTMVSRVIAWDANGDTQASLKDLERIERNARTATVGEVALSLSLAVVSGLLAILLVQNLVPKQLAYPLVTFVVAALSYGLYAPTSWRWVSIVGLVCVVIGLALTAAILLAPNFALLLPLPSVATPVAPTVTPQPIPASPTLLPG